MNFRELIKISKVKKMKFAPIDLEQNHVGGGIYRMFNDSGEIIYVGKSQDLHRRLHQHIGKDTNTAYFIDEVKKFEWFPHSSPIMQNLLEAIFIAFHEPKYNEEVKAAKKERIENESF